MSASWIVREAAPGAAPSWAVKSVVDGAEVTTHVGLSPREAKLAMYRLMFGLSPVECEARTLQPVPNAARQRVETGRVAVAA